MMEQQLMQYGILGLWTLSLLAERYRTQGQIRKLIENNTEALIKNYEVLNYVRRKQ